MSENPENEITQPRIVVRPNGSLRVYGNIPLVHKTQVVSEYGEPLTWQKVKDYHAKNKVGKDFYSLCRCGQSKTKPYCDGTHEDIDFDGTEKAGTGPTASRSMRIPRGKHITVKKDNMLCSEAGFCGLRDSGIFELVTATEDPRVRSLVIAMVERCPSGALTYRIEPEGADIEPDLPVQIAVTTEITSEGPIEGPFWVTGNVPVLRSDGLPFETRNRVTLCSCGLSKLKPLCDGTHREVQEQALREAKASQV